jgi:hypothetical protein
MSNDFRKVLLKDDRLMVTDSLNYAVIKGGQNVVSQVASAISQSTSNISFNVQVPSEQTIIDRKVYIQSTVTLKWETATAESFCYGQTLSLAPFPIHQLCSTIQTTINNNVTSINIRDVLPFLLRSNDSRELQKSMSSSPSMPDSLYYYSDANGTVVNNVLGTMSQGLDTDLLANGAYAGVGKKPVADAGTVQTVVDPLVVPPAGPQAVTLYTSTNGTLYVPQTYVPTASTYWALQFTTIEPVLCQPFLFSNPVSNKQGMYGVQTIQLQYNIADARRAFRCWDGFGSPNFVPTVINNLRVDNIVGSQLIFKFLTPHPSDLLPPRNVIPLLTYDRYFSNAKNDRIWTNWGNKITIQSNTYNLTQIPDKICIFLRKNMTLQQPYDTDHVPVITNISLNFNNNAGLLSSATIQDLYQYSVQAGSNQSFQEFCGQAYLSNRGGVGNSAQSKPTVGSYLMLDFATIIQLTEDFYAPGSLGNFQLQFQVQVQNQDQADPDSIVGQSALYDIPANSLELVLVVMNSGIMVTERGQTSTYTGILTKQDVLDASQQTPFSITNVQRIVGSGSLDRGRALPASIGHAMASKSAPVVAKALEMGRDAMSKRLM